MFVLLVRSDLVGVHSRMLFLVTLDRVLILALELVTYRFILG